jgi:hypothetical protein
MPFPPAIDQSIRKRFADLIAEGESLRVAMNDAEQNAHATSSVVYLGEYSVCVTDFNSYRTRVLGLMAYVGVDRHEAEVQQAQAKPSRMEVLLGIVKGLADDYAGGFLDSVVRRAEAEVAADYLGKRSGFLKEGEPGKYNHGPAAVLLGATLEQALRTLCGRQVPVISTTKANGEKLTMGTLIERAKKKAGVYNELKAKQLACADIRNAAAHGEFARFVKSDVEHMIQGVGTFLADYP